MSDYSPDPIPGLEAEHPAEARPGVHVPEHDRPEPVAPDMISIRARYNQARDLQRIMTQDWRTDPLGARLYFILKDDHAMLVGNREPIAVYLRQLIEELIPSLREAGPTDTQRLDFLLRHSGDFGFYGFNREWIDREMRDRQGK